MTYGRSVELGRTIPSTPYSYIKEHYLEVSFYAMDERTLAMVG